MEKYLIEIFGVYGKGDADKEVESFVINSIEELEETMEGYEWLCSDGGKSDYQIEKEYKDKKEELNKRFGN